MASNGTRVSDTGQVRTNLVAVGYVPIGSDVHINGTLHDNAGNMYHTNDANAGASDVFINGIRHTNVGVRYTDDTGKAISWPEAFTVATDGRQGTIAGSAIFLRGISRNLGGRMTILAA